MTTDDSVERTDRVEQSLNISEDEMKEIYNNGKPIPYDDSVKKLVAEFKTSMQCGTDERTGKRQYLVEDEEWEEIISTLTTFKDQCVRSGVTEDTSDGYHTFKELYEFRKLYNAALFNEWARQGLYDVHKSQRHNDGELCFGSGWFIVMATLPTGQVSNHYELKDWELFKCDEREKADKWDGHSAQEVAERLTRYLTKDL